MVETRSKTLQCVKTPGLTIVQLNSAKDTQVILEISRIKCAYYTTQFNFKLYISNVFDSSSAVKAYKNTLQQSRVQEFKN